MSMMPMPIFIPMTGSSDQSNVSYKIQYHGDYYDFVSDGQSQRLKYRKRNKIQRFAVKYMPLLSITMAVIGVIIALILAHKYLIPSANYTDKYMTINKNHYSSYESSDWFMTAYIAFAGSAVAGILTWVTTLFVADSGKWFYFKTPANSYTAFNSLSNLPNIGVGEENFAFKLFAAEMDYTSNSDNFNALDNVSSEILQLSHR